MTKCFFKLPFILAFIFNWPICLFAANYYISFNGDDANEGTSQNWPIATINRLNQIQLNPGDSLLFEREGRYYGQLIINNSGTKLQPIIIGAYGIGKNPVIEGAYDLKNWQNQGNDIYINKVKVKIHQVYWNEKLLTKARFPDNGYLRIDKPDSTYLIDASLGELDKLKGATIRALTCNWQWEIRKAVSQKGDTIKLDSLVWRPFKKGFGYYLENKMKFFDNYGEWIQDEKYLRIKSKAKPENGKIKITTLDYGLLISKNTKNIVIENLEFSMFNFAGINAKEHVKNIKIENNIFSNIEVFAIYLDTAANNCNILNNSIKDIRGLGISCLEPQKCIISRNKIKRIGLIPGYGFDGVNNATGIAIINNEFRDKTYTRVAHKNIISYNRIDSTGYNGIRVDGTENKVMYNIVKDAVLSMNDGGGIYCWALPNNYNYTTKNIFKSNIVQRVHGNTEASAGDYNMTCGFYMDNFSNNITLTNNSAFDCEIGFLFNDATFNIDFRNNFTYNTDAGLVIDIYKKDSLLKRGMNNITGNTFYINEREDVGVKIKYQQNHQVNLGVIDSNKYISPVYYYINAWFYRENKKETNISYQLSSWQDETGFDLNSQFFGPLPEEKWWELRDDSELFINETDKIKMVRLDADRFVNENNQIVNEFELEPYTAIVLSKKE